MDTKITPQVLDHALRKRQLLGPIGYILQGQILRYHELGQVSQYLGGRCDIGNVICRGVLGSSSLNANTIMMAAQGVRRTKISSAARE